MRNLALLALVAACGRPPSQGAAIKTTISGRVLDAVNGQALAGALVQTEPYLSHAVAGSEGLFVLNEPTLGVSYRITASKTGYASNSLTIPSVTEGVNTVADIQLTKSAALLMLSATSVQLSASDTRGSFLVENAGDRGQPLTWSATPSDAWITEVSPSSGTVLSTDAAVIVKIDRTLLPAGTGEVDGTISVTSNGGSGTVAVRALR